MPTSLDSLYQMDDILIDLDDIQAVVQVES
jgi:hypothetical protein